MKITIKQFYILPLIIIVFLFSYFIVSAAPGSKFKITITPASQCADGVDNDNDSKIDYPNDPNCDTPNDDNETGTTTPPSGGAGGGGGGGAGGAAAIDPGLTIAPVTSVSFSGKAYPSRVVKLLRDGELVASTISGKNANFQISLQGLTPGNHLFSIYSEDSSNRRSAVLPFNLFVAQGAIIQLSGIFIPPTVEINKTDFALGEVVSIFGQTTPESQVSIVVHSEKELFLKTEANSNGIYSYSLDTALLEVGGHELKTRASSNDEVSDYSRALNFNISKDTKNATSSEAIKPPTSIEMKKKSDINSDAKVNLIDFSIAAFWYKKTATNEDAKKVDLNNDGVVNLIDFSILAFYWTG